MGIRTGAGMRRGTIVSLQDASMLPSFEYSCTYHPLFLRLYFSKLRANGSQEKFKTSIWMVNLNVFVENGIELNRGEVLLFER